MKITFITPCLRQAKFLPKCLDSIAAQNLAPGDFEVRVYDGGSNDGTTGILKAHPLHPWWVSEPDKGQAAAVNRGLREAKGDIIGWLNADDSYLPGAVHAVLDVFAREPETDVVYGEARFVDPTGNDLGSYPVKPWSYAEFADGCFLCQPAVFFRRRVVESDGFLDESLHLALDYEFWLRLGRHRVFRHVPQVLAASRVHPGGITNRLPIPARRTALVVSHRHTGQWSPVLLRSLASRVSESFWARLGLHSTALTWLGKQFVLSYYRMRLRWCKNPFPLT